MASLHYFYFVTATKIRNICFIQGKYYDIPGSFSVKIYKDIIDENREINERYIIINHNNTRYSIELEIFPDDEELYPCLNFENYQEYIPPAIYAVVCGMCATAIF